MLFVQQKKSPTAIFVSKTCFSSFLIFISNRPHLTLVSCIIKCLKEFRTNLISSRMITAEALYGPCHLNTEHLTSSNYLTLPIPLRSLALRVRNQEEGLAELAIQALWGGVSLCFKRETVWWNKLQENKYMPAQA